MSPAARAQGWRGVSVVVEASQMAEIILNVDVREGVGTGGARAARRAGFVPGVLYGGDKAKSWIAYPEKWVVPTDKTVENFFPKTAEDIDFIEEVWETCPPSVYASNFFKQCEREIGFHAVKPGLDFTLPPMESSGSARPLLGARDADTGEISLD